MEQVRRVCRQYTSGTAALSLLLLGGTALVSTAWYGLIAAAFHIVCSAAYIWGWQAMARRAPENLPKYYLAGSAFRLMAAAVVLLVFCVINRADSGTIRRFAIVFVIFYIVMLTYDAVFFAKVSKKS